MSRENTPFMMPKTAVASSEEISQKSSHSEGLNRSWHPGVLRHFPWMGFAALAAVVASCGATIGILVSSNGDPVNSWSLSPSVCLAICNAVAVATLTFAYSEGVVISWWRKTLLGGTAADLHRNWSYGQSAFKSIAAGKQFNIVAAASLMTVIVFVAGPLLQRASHTTSTTITALTNVTASLSTVLPYGYTGIVGGRGVEMGFLTPPFAQVLADYTNRDAIKVGFTGCNGTCSGKIEAAGIAVNCSTTSYPANYNAPLDVFALTRNASGLAVEQLTFATNFTWQPKNLPKPAQINMLTAYRSSSDVNCSGEVTVKSCTLRPSTVNYDLQIKDGVVTLSKDIKSYTSGPLQNTSLIKNDPTDSQQNSQRSTLGGLSWVATNLFASNASYSFRGAIGWQLAQSGIMVQQYTKTDTSAIYNRAACNGTWRDPTDDILLALHELMFRTAIISANTSTYVNARNATAEQLLVAGPRQISVIQQSTVQVYRTEYRYLAGALIIYMLALMFVMATFWGFWELGRKFSMSPIETAKAFDAPALQGAGTNLPVAELLDIYKKTPLKYGAVPGGPTGMKLVLGSTETEKPAVGSTFQ